MKRLVIAAAAFACAAAQADYSHTTYTGSDTNLKTLTVETDGKFVLGTGDYSNSEWDWTKERVYDGVTELQNGDEVVQRWFEPGWVHGPDDCNWAGYQTQSPVVVTHISFVTRHDEYAERARGCRFEGANTADFSDAVALYTVPADADVETLKAGWVEIDIDESTLLNTPFTYLRVVADDEFCGNFIEVEFYGKTWAEATSEAPSFAPQNFTAVGGDANVTLSWDLPSFSCQSVRVVRATAPGGPFTTTVATLSSVLNTCEDAVSNLTPGVKYYYSAYFLNNANDAELVGVTAHAASYRHVAEITFDASSMTAVEYHHDYGSEAATVSAAKLFDGDTTTNPDVVNSSAGNDGVKVGVDFGAGNEHVITGFKVFPSREWNGSLNQWVVGRSDGIQLAGSNDMSDWTNGIDISDVCDIYKENAWDDTQLSWSAFSTTVTNAYRYVFLKKDARQDLAGCRTDDFYGNVRELKLYGYSAANAMSVLLAPENAAAEWHGTRAVITWTASPNAASYKVERSSDGGATWPVFAEGIADTTYTDRPTKTTSISYIYRVASVDNSGNLAYTDCIVPVGEPTAPGMTITVY